MRKGVNEIMDEIMYEIIDKNKNEMKNTKKIYFKILVIECQQMN